MNANTGGDWIDRGLWGRLAALCGALFPLGTLIGDDTVNDAGEPPEHDASLSEIETYISSADASTSYWIGRGIGTLAFAALLVFAVYAARRIRARESREGLVSGLVLASGAAAVAVLIVGGAAQFAAVQRADEGVPVELARAFLDLSGILFGLGFGLIAVLLGSIAVAGFRYGFVPRWLAAPAGLLGAGLLAGLAAAPSEAAFGFPLVLTFLWFIVAGVRLAVKREVVAAES